MVLFSEFKGSHTELQADIGRGGSNALDDLRLQLRKKLRHAEARGGGDELNQQLRRGRPVRHDTCVDPATALAQLVLCQVRHSY